MSQSLTIFLLSTTILLVVHDLAVRLTLLFNSSFSKKYYSLVTLITDLVIVACTLIANPANELLLTISLLAWVHFLLYSVIANAFPNDRFPGPKDYWLTIPSALLLFVLTKTYYLTLITNLI